MNLLLLHIVKLITLLCTYDGNTTKLASEITNNSSQIIQSVEKSLGIDLKSVLAGYLGGKLLSKSKESEDKSEETPKEEK